MLAATLPAPGSARVEERTCAELWNVVAKEALLGSATSCFPNVESSVLKTSCHARISAAAFIKLWNWSMTTKSGKCQKETKKENCTLRAALASFRRPVLCRPQHILPPTLPSPIFLVHRLLCPTCAMPYCTRERVKDVSISVVLEPPRSGAARVPWQRQS